MAFETDEATVLLVTDVMVPSDYGGVMVTDRGRSYAQALSEVKSRNVWPTCCARSVRWSRPREGEVAASAIV